MSQTEKPERPSRRTAIVKSAQLAALTALGLPAACAEHDSSQKHLKRIVTGENAEGLSTQMFADSELQLLEFNGSRVFRLWETDGIPANLPIDADHGATAGNAYREGFAGSSLYVADIPAGVPASKVAMHKESSLDYMAVLSGEIWLLLETEEVLMRTGDVLVQGGNLHGWENRSDKPCRLLVVAMHAIRIA